MTELISARKQDWNFLFWQALIWNKTKENSNFSTCYIFSYILPSSILTQQHSTVLVIWLKSVLKRESMEIWDEIQNLFVQKNWIMN